MIHWNYTTQNLIPLYDCANSQKPYNVEAMRRFRKAWDEASCCTIGRFIYFSTTCSGAVCDWEKVRDTVRNSLWLSWKYQHYQQVHFEAHFGLFIQHFRQKSETELDISKILWYNIRYFLVENSRFRAFCVSDNNTPTKLPMTKNRLQDSKKTVNWGKSQWVKSSQSLWYLWDYLPL